MCSRHNISSTCGKVMTYPSGQLAPRFVNLPISAVGDAAQAALSGSIINTMTVIHFQEWREGLAVSNHPTEHGQTRVIYRTAPPR